MSWNDERVEQMKKRWLEGWSCSQIAGELGNGISRNAVIGKIHRLGLSGRVKPARKAWPSRAGQVRNRPAPAPRAAARAQSATTIGGNGRVYAKAPAKPLAPEPPPVLAEMRLLTIMELKSDSCRWPVGEPSESSFRFCGSDANIGGSYCRFHRMLSIGQGTRSEREAVNV